MANNAFSMRYGTGRASNLAMLIFNRERTTMRTTGTTMTALGSIADANWAAGRLSFTEKTTSDATGTGLYVAGAFPALTAGYYLLEVYDVVTPANSSPGPTTLPLTLDFNGEIYWTGTDINIGSHTVTTSVEAEGSLGTGADEVTLTLTLSGDPAVGVEVWVTTDAAGDVIAAGTATTNDSGQVTFMLDSGSSYYFWSKGVGSANNGTGTLFVAAAD